ncbi:hypothetical protein HRI_001684500 [Hibiscus trionum]|uniref:NAC domain-containing protein n=1 Tax=Hibiscus trionum TaxID=183268 RepID=A0A9W7HML4_HIBTR|nr:hypothetical protein HRI_001684500 [Hibiscus trionum]
MTNIPVGFRFNPTEVQLIECYLTKKVKGEPLPCDVICDCEIYGGEDKDPWNIFGETSSKTFCIFSKLKKKGKGRRIDRTAGCSTWKGQRTDDVKDSKNNLIGFKKLFVFKVKGSKSNNGGKGHWLMHEFSLRHDDHSDYVLCAIYNKNRINVDEPPQKRERISSLVEEDHVSPTPPSPAAPIASHPVSDFGGAFTAEDIDNMLNFTKDNEYVIGNKNGIMDDDDESPRKRARFSSIVEEDHVSTILSSTSASPTVPYPTAFTSSHSDTNFRGAFTEEDIDDMINFMKDNEYFIRDVVELEDDNQIQPSIQNSGQVQQFVQTPGESFNGRQ